MPFPVLLEIALSALLLATVGYCAVLERKLAALRKGQDGLKSTIADLNAAVTTAGKSMRDLKAAAAEASETLDRQLTHGRALADELAVLVTAGERIANRIDRATPSTSPPNGLPAALAARLTPQMPGRLR